MSEYLQSQIDRRTFNSRRGLALGAGVGLIFGAAFNNPGVGLVLGAALGSAFPALIRGLKVDENGTP